MSSPSCECSQCDVAAYAKLLHDEQRIKAEKKRVRAEMARRSPIRFFVRNDRTGQTWGPFLEQQQDLEDYMARTEAILYASQYTISIHHPNYAAHVNRTAATATSTAAAEAATASPLPPCQCGQC